MRGEILVTQTASAEGAFLDTLSVLLEAQRIRTTILPDTGKPGYRCLLKSAKVSVMLWILC